MTVARTSTAPEVAEVNESNVLKIVALWAKITGQGGFQTEDGNFENRDKYALGRLNMEGQNLEIIVQQSANNGIRTIVVSKLSDGIPLVICTIPGDANEDTTVKIDGRISDASEFYDGVVSLLSDKQIGDEEVSRLKRKNAETILTTLI